MSLLRRRRSSVTTDSRDALPKDTPFYQQHLRAWRPLVTPAWAVLSLAAVAVPLLSLGYWARHQNTTAVAYRVQYDGPGTDPRYAACALPATAQGAGPGAPGGAGGVPPASGPRASCTVTFTTDRPLRPPVLLQYELAGFYANHRTYVKSYHADQLRGVVVTDPAKLTSCDPLVTTPYGRVLHPCGLIAQSFFNDTFALASTTAPGGLALDETGIAWEQDRKTYKGVPLAERARYPNVVWISDVFPNVPDVTDEHFMVWMRPAALPTFRKLYGRLRAPPGAAADAELPAGTVINVAVTANFPVASFGGSKALVLAVPSALGGTTPFLATSLLATGFAALGLAALLAVRTYFGGRALGDTAFLAWPGRRGR